MKLLLLLILPWHLLMWSDFKGKQTDPNFIAVTSSLLDWQYTCDDDDTLIYNLKCTALFDSKESFTTTKSLAALKHEQGHLDIAMIFAKKANRKAKEILTVSDFNNFQIKIEKEWREMEEDYDTETDHSINLVMQDRWNKWIAEQLK